jgi:hypothetical protein
VERETEAAARLIAVDLAGVARDGAADHFVASTSTALDREREEHLACLRREEAVRDAEVAVGLGQHKRDAQRDRRGTRGAGHVATAADDHVDALALQDLPSSRCRTDGEPDRPRRLQRVAAVDARDLQRVERITGRRHELGLRPLSAEEQDVRAAFAQGIRDGERRHDVSRGPTGGNRNPQVRV